MRASIGDTLRVMRLLSFVFLACLIGPLSAATPHDEIEGLLSHFKQLDGAVFIRNGTEHSAAEAAAHLRMKWDKQSDKIKSAEDFISLCATKSLVSGERYRIRFKDGKVRDSADVLAERLATLREKK